MNLVEKPHHADRETDLLVIGAGIVGLAHAAAAVARGLRVSVVERDARAVGASVRNFGHVCATAQGGAALELARDAREHWIQLGAKAGFDVMETGTVVVARTTAELGVLEELAAERGADEVTVLNRDQVTRRVPVAATEVVGGAHLPLDLRVDPRAALPALARWLADEGVDFRWGTHVGAVEPGRVLTSYGELAASAIVVATGHDLDRLFPDIAAEQQVRRCRLHMFEVASPGGAAFEPAVLTGTSMLRYAGLAAMPATLLAVLGDVLGSVAAQGGRRVVVVNGHGGNVGICQAAAADAASSLGLAVAHLDYWRLAPREDDVFAPGHAGEFETSLMLALHPGTTTVPEARSTSPAVLAVDDVGVHTPALWQAIDGYTDEPAKAEAVAGRARLDHLVARAADRFIELAEAL